MGIGTLTVPGLPVPHVPRQGILHAACGSVAVEVGGQREAMQPIGTIAQLDAGLPLQARSCSGSVTMAAGIREIRALPGIFSVDLLQLRSPAPVTRAGAGRRRRVVDPGTIGTSSVSGARVALKGPSWVVLGESFDAGWRAVCDGRSLGAPRVIDGYANGWPAPASCRRIEFSFAPQSSVRTSYWVSGLTCLLLIVLMTLGVVRGRIGPIEPKTRTLFAKPERDARRLRCRGPRRSRWRWRSRSA